MQRRWVQLERIASDLNATERDAGLPQTRNPDPGFFAVAHGWAAGEDLADVIGDEAVTGGDFVRNMKQLIDLLRQLAIVTADDVAEDVDRRRAGRRPPAPGGRGRVVGRGLTGRPGRTVPIAKGSEYGEPGPVPDGLVTVRSDAEARAALEQARRERRPYPPLGLLGGDLCRTLGGGAAGPRSWSASGSPSTWAWCWPTAGSTCSSPRWWPAPGSGPGRSWP